MKDFKLEVGGKYILRGDKDKKPECRAKIRVLATDMQSNRPVAVSVLRLGQTECLASRLANGQNYNREESCDDLIPEPLIVELWINVYPDGSENFHKTREAADRCASSDRVACIHIVREYYEGEGL